MPYNPDRHHRRSIRLQGFDYRSCGYYYLTIVTHQREQCLSSIRDGVVHLLSFGTIVNETWGLLPTWFPFIELDALVIMPDHLHGILSLHPQKLATNSNHKPRTLPRGTIPSSLPAIVQTFKSRSAHNINQIRQTKGQRFWQEDYFERIIRHEEELSGYRQYIANNPARWSKNQ